MVIFIATQNCANNAFFTIELNQNVLGFFKRAAADVLTLGHRRTDATRWQPILWVAAISRGFQNHATI